MEQPYKILFSDIGGVLLTNGWGHESRQAAAKKFGIDYGEMDVLHDFIFIDINMPKMDGLECLSKIKKIKKLENVPMIIYSTGSDSVIKNKAMKLGAANCITKTTSITSLTEILKTILF